jgi:hypothetical protein
MTEGEREDIKAIAMNVFTQMYEPYRKELEGVKMTLRSIYSNSSGGPPGYLENARAQDLEKWETLVDSIKPVLRYVAARQTLDEAEKEASKKRASRMKVWIPIAAAVLIALMTWFIPKVWAVGSFLWDDYLKAHPTTSLRHLSDAGDRASAGQLADIPSSL